MTERMTTGKRILTLLAALALAMSMFLLAACGNGEEAGSADSGSESAETQNSDASGGESEDAADGEAADSSDSGASNSATEAVTYSFAINRDTDPLRRRDAHSGWICIDEEIMAAIAKDQGFKVKSIDDYADLAAAQTALGAGDVVAIAAQDIAAGGDFDYTQACYEVGGVSYGLAIAKGQNAEFLQQVDAGLANIKSGGALDEIIAKYTEE